MKPQTFRLIIAALALIAILLTGGLLNLEIGKHHSAGPRWIRTSRYHLISGDEALLPKACTAGDVYIASNTVNVFLCQ